jgi:hypothetical protein
MGEMKDLEEVVQKVKGVEDGVANLIVPILKDTIKDTNQHNKRLFIMNIVLAVALLLVSIGAMVLVAIQNQKYADFLSQFEFEETVYQETSDNSNINSGINITK